MVIGTDGSVTEIYVVEGHCWLAEAAVKAVRQWRYEPTIVDGEPVEVRTTATVRFTLKFR